MANESTPAYKRPISDALAQTPAAKLMSRKIIYAMPGTPIHVAMQMMITHKISGLPVADGNTKCLGIYSELDAMLQGASQPLESPIKFTKPAITVTPTTPFREVLILIVKKKLKRVPVIDGNGNLVGIISRADIMKVLYEDHLKGEAELETQKKIAALKKKG
jgi:tRNA nucleotidyltransferase (CCA-adding enzyme)